MKTLIIGDNANVMQAIADLLHDNFAFEVNHLPYRKKFLHQDIDLLKDAGLIILDLTTVKTNPRMLIREIRAIFPQVIIIALHIYKEISLVQALVDAGANAYLPIDTLHQEMEKAIENLRQGNNYLSTEVGV